MKKLSTQQKVIYGIIALAVVIIIVRYSSTLIKKLGGSIDKSAQTLALESQGMTQSFSKSEYASFADQIEVAIYGFGTDEDTIYNVFNQMNNDLDIVQLEKAFGVRDGQSLASWLTGDLSSDEIDTINGILLNAGINKSY